MWTAGNQWHCRLLSPSDAADPVLVQQVRPREQFEQQLRSWGFDRAQGDATKLDVPIQG
jgi:hypothetical protein